MAAQIEVSAGSQYNRRNRPLPIFDGKNPGAALEKHFTTGKAESNAQEQLVADRRAGIIHDEGNVAGRRSAICTASYETYSPPRWR